MDQDALSRTASGSINATARYVRRGAAAIRDRAARIGEPITERSAERLALSEWASLNGRLLPFDFVEQFHYIGSGAEHSVYHDPVPGLAIKATRANQFGHSTYGPGFTATPSEYLRRLAWSNLLFGDDFRLLGVSLDEEGQIEIVCSQPWIKIHPIRPAPFEEEIDAYFRQFGFFRSPLNPEAPVFYHMGFNLLVADANDTNVLRDTDEKIVAIDVVVGTPGPGPYAELRKAFKFADRLYAST